MKNPHNHFTVRGKILEKKKPLFNYPFNSKYLKMWQIKTECTGEEQVYDLQTMDSKLQ